ncbi:MAG: glycosyltransferase family 2 protein [Clostridia bacterium]|jgi:glycosyltransferase involved in cell wall biosynthesis|nr:glycosyltransferase family 2 protein [Clostridia bacterium]
MISILLASYNGEKYISQQIESVLNQTYRDFVLYINDDCSTDKTYEIAKAYETKYPEKIKVTQNQKNSGGAKYNFIDMMINHKDDYIMLCDQDDVWMPDKIKITLRKMHNIEMKSGEGKPILVHTDLKIVDEELNIISPSFKKFMCADYNKAKLNNLLIQNIITGCTVMYNRALSKLIKEPEGYIVMHDWWLAIIASAFGSIQHVDEATILYRQHGNNSIGVRNMRSIKFILTYMVRLKKIKKALADTYCQAEVFYRTYEKEISNKQKKLLKTYCMIPKKNKVAKIFTVFKLKTFKNGIVRNIGYILYI